MLDWCSRHGRPCAQPRPADAGGSQVLEREPEQRERGALAIALVAVRGQVVVGDVALAIPEHHAQRVGAPATRGTRSDPGPPAGGERRRATTRGCRGCRGGRRGSGKACTSRRARAGGRRRPRPSGCPAAHSAVVGADERRQGSREVGDEVLLERDRAIAKRRREQRRDRSRRRGRSRPPRSPERRPRRRRAAPAAASSSRSAASARQSRQQKSG